MNAPIIDPTTFKNLKAMVGEDFIGELVETFFEEAPRLMADLQASLLANDAPAFTRAAHSFKSNSASFGASRLAELAKELEQLGRTGALDQAAPRLAQLETEYAQVEQALKELL